jgi:hypothetical protein
VNQDLSKSSYTGQCWTRIAGPYIEPDANGRDWVCGGVLVEDCVNGSNSLTVKVQKEEEVYYVGTDWITKYEFSRDIQIPNGAKTVNGYVEACFPGSEGNWKILAMVNGNTLDVPGKAYPDLNHYDFDKYDGGNFPYDQVLSISSDTEDTETEEPTCSLSLEGPVYWYGGIYGIYGGVWGQAKVTCSAPRDTTVWVKVYEVGNEDNYQASSFTCTNMKSCWVYNYYLPCLGGRSYQVTGWWY